jgi:hypothetical protein
VALAVTVALAEMQLVLVS